MRRHRQDLVCPLSLAKGAVHGQSTGQGTTLESSGTTGLAEGQQESLGMETRGLRLHTLGNVRAAGAQSQLHSIPWHLPFAQPTSNRSSSRGSGCTHTPRGLTGLFHRAAQQTAWAPANLQFKSGTYSPKTSLVSDQSGDARSCPCEVLPFLLTAAMLHTCTAYSLAGSSKAFLTSRQFTVSKCPKRSVWVVD